MPAELRIMRNVRSLDGRGRRAMATLNEIIAAGTIEVRFICDGASHVLTADSPCPVLLLPGTLGSSGAVDKKDNPLKQRMVVNNTAPNSSIERPVRVRNAPNGVPDGPHVLSLNESTGDKTPGPKRDVPGKPTYVSQSRPRVPPVASHMQLSGPPNLARETGVVDVRRGGDDSDAANPFVWDGRVDRAARERLVAAMRDGTGTRERMRKGARL